MSIEEILTVVGVALAVLALVPSERAQALQVRLGRGIKYFAAASAVLILYLAFLEQLHGLPGVRSIPRPLAWYSGWHPANLSLLVLLLLTGAALWSYHRRLPLSRLPRLAVALSDAVARRRHGECIHLLGAHLPTIIRAHQGKYLWARLRERVAPTLGELLTRARPKVAAAERPSPEKTAHDISSGPLVSLTFPRPPTYPPIVTRAAVWAERPRNTAHDIIRLLSRAPELTEEIAGADPYLGREILKIESSWVMDSFAEDFARALVSDPRSALYRELRGAENLDHSGWPSVDDREQPLLALLCEDALSSTGPRLTYTFLDAGIDPVRNPRRDHLHDELSGPLGDYHERGRWTSPPYFTVALLQIVVPRLAALPSLAAGFLNLYVARTLVQSLLSRLTPPTTVDLTREWPTPTHYLAYEIVSLLVDTVRAPLRRANATREVGREPLGPFREHAADVLGAVMDVCMRSDSLDSRFRGYLLEVWWRAYADKYDGEWEGSKHVLHALVHGGLHGSDIRNPREVEEALSHIDIVLQVSEPASELKRQLGIL